MLVKLCFTYNIISYFRAVYIFYIYFDMYMYVRYDKQLTEGDLQLLEISPQIGKRMTEGQHAFGIVVGISKKIFILVREVNILYKRNFGLINPMNDIKKAHVQHRSIQVYYYSITTLFDIFVTMNFPSFKKQNSCVLPK